MKDKDYQKPTIDIVEMQLQIALMGISGGEAERIGYGKSEKQNWDEDEEEESNCSNLWNDEEY